MIPLPQRLGRLLALSDAAPATNRSLVFHRGVDTYVGNAEHGLEFRRDEEGQPKGRQEFFETFTTQWTRADEAPSGEPAYRDFCTRRRAALEAAGAEIVEATTDGRLIVGMGLPHPTENALLLDRLTGSPYLPGSSVKGLLRSAARAVAAGELPGDEELWQRSWEIVFGPPIGEGAGARGLCAFFDAFPTAWPKLEADVMTPHYQAYYSEPGQPPADWLDPKPIPFLAVAAQTTFLFPYRLLPDPRPSATELAEKLPEKLRQLLSVALELLGAGAKTAAGYGLFRPFASPPKPVETLRVVVHLSIDAGPGEVRGEIEGKKVRGPLAKLLEEYDEGHQKQLKKRIKKNKPIECDVVEMGLAYEIVRLIHPRGAD